MTDKIKKIVFLLLCFLVLSCTTASHSLSTRPYLSQVTENSIVVSWHTSVPTPTVVEYGETKAYGFSVRTDKQTRFHSITLTALKPSTEYHYRVHSGKSTQDYTFHTAVKPGEPFTFAVYGDTRPNNENHVQVLRQILKARPLFIINAGDMTKDDKETYWQDYFSVICDKTGAAEIIPIYSTMGNHDGIGHGSAALYFRYFVLPVNDFYRDEAYYSFDIGDAHFISLNSYLPFDPGSPQYEWLAEDLKKSAYSKWKIVFLHEPLYSTGKHGSNLNERMILSPLFEQGGVSLVFSGHDHIYERTEKIRGVTYIVTGGGGSSLYSAARAEWVAASDQSHHFCKVRIGGNHCDVTMIRADGTTGDRFVLTR